MSVLATSLSPSHIFTKSSTTSPKEGILLITHHGVHNDCHAGPTVQHRSRLHIKPHPPNLRQVHLLHSELLTLHSVNPGEIGENVTTIGLDLLGLGEGDILKFIPLTTTPTAPSSSPTSSSTVPPTGQDDYPATEQDLEERIRNDEKIEGATIRITGLRNPCPQIDKFRTGLREKFLVRDKDRNVVGRKAGVMSTVEKGGWVRPGMKILIEKAGERRELVCV